MATAPRNKSERTINRPRDGRATARTSPRVTDVRVTGAELYLLPVTTRVPLKFGSETLTSVTCARARIQVTDHHGRSAWGWGETPLSVQWAWPGELSYNERYQTMIDLCRQLVPAVAKFEVWGHPIEIGSEILGKLLPMLRRNINENCKSEWQLPRLAALVCLSPFDIALHDAFGVLHGVPTYETYQRPWMDRDLSHFLEPGENSDADFHGKYPRDFLDVPPHSRLTAWHLVGGLDPLDRSELNGEPHDASPVLLDDWITRDGLTCLKIKLRGNDAEWDYNRIVQVGRIALARGIRFLSTDFNCTVTDVSYVTAVLDKLVATEPSIYDLILYIEQPFPYELEEHPTDVRSLSARKPLFMDESAHDWKQVRLGRSLGWTGVALKTCKTQTGAILSLCWAKAHGMDLMVQDLTNPMLAQIPHVLLASYAGTVMGVETNAMQFYPQASVLEAGIHTGLYARLGGQIDLSTIRGPGFGYDGAEAVRTLPPPTASFVAAGESSVPAWHVKR